VGAGDEFVIELPKIQPLSPAPSGNLGFPEPEIFGSSTSIPSASLL